MSEVALRPTDDWVSWGRVQRAPCERASARFLQDAQSALTLARFAGRSALGVGLGRSYGDSNLNPGGALIDLTGADRLIAFDPETGVLRAEAGASLSSLIRFAAPRGWFLPTTPGTRFVTLGGAIANDVHGKNHHRAGTFGAHVRRFGLLRSDRGLLEVTPESEPELYAATIGGLGLTGLILWAEVGLVPIRSTLIETETTPFNKVEEFFQLSREGEARFEHTVAWVDCTSAQGRGLFTGGNWASEGPRPIHDDRAMARLPIDAPGFALNPLSLRAFNALYFACGKAAKGVVRQPYWRHFYPLDAIGGWNKLYGAKGFFQHQSVIPPPAAEPAVKELLKAVAKSGQGSMLAVLKTFGAKASPGLLSFPREGATLALDFANHGASTRKLLDRLDAIVHEAGGRLYPAKEGRMTASQFRAGYPAFGRFAGSVDPAFSSAFWRRVSA